MIRIRARGVQSSEGSAPMVGACNIGVIIGRMYPQGAEGIGDAIMR